MPIFFLFSVPTHKTAAAKRTLYGGCFFVTESPGRAGEGLPAPYPFGESVWFPGKLLQWAHLIVHSRPSGLEQAAPSGSPERPAPTLGWRRNSPPSLIRTAAAYCCRLNRRPSPGASLAGGDHRRQSYPDAHPEKGLVAYPCVHPSICAGTGGFRHRVTGMSAIQISRAAASARVWRGAASHT